MKVPSVRITELKTGNKAADKAPDSGKSQKSVSGNSDFGLHLQKSAAKVKSFAGNAKSFADNAKSFSDGDKSAGQTEKSFVGNAAPREASLLDNFARQRFVGNA